VYAFNGDLVSRLLASTTDATVELVGADDELSLVLSKGEYALKKCETTCQPVLPTDWDARVSSSALQRVLISASRFAFKAATEKWFLADGVAVRIDGSSIIAYSGNNARLFQFEVNNVCKGNSALWIPTQLIPTIANVSPLTDDAVNIAVVNSWIYLARFPRMVAFTPPEGKPLPSVNEIIGHRLLTRVLTVDCAELKDAVLRAKTVNWKTTIKTIGDSQVRIVAKNAKWKLLFWEDIQAEVFVQKMLSFQTAYLLDFLNAASGLISIYSIEGTSAKLFKAGGVSACIGEFK
jgi:hypothetical protein